MAGTEPIRAGARGRPAVAGTLTDAEILAQVPAARARASLERRRGLRALAVRYSVAHEALFLTLANGTIVGVKVSAIPALRRASHRQRGAVRVTPTGAVLRWDALDVDLGVPALVREALGADALRSLFGSAGGRSTSTRKAEAARTNGAKGGRPRTGVLRRVR